MASESDFLDWVKHQQSPSALVQLPAGDDLAILRWKGDDLLLVGNDQVLDGVHFDSKVHPPELIGRKAMNRNLSDCAAMACLPAAAVVTMALPRGTSMEYAQKLYEGMRDAAAKFDCPIVGGDTASWDGKLVVTVSILGRSAGIEPITRSGAKPGDVVYVTGPLGGSLLGRHMTFEPRIQLARELAKKHRMTAMIDLSDGLSRDAWRIAQQSNVAIVIVPETIPIHPDAIEMRRDGVSPLEHALHDGEDYQLLFMAPPGALALAIGEVGVGSGVAVTRGDKLQRLEPKAWDHQF